MDCGRAAGDSGKDIGACWFGRAKAGRVPNIVVALMQTLDDAGLWPYFVVVGTHALYTY